MTTTPWWLLPREAGNAGRLHTCHSRVSATWQRMRWRRATSGHQLPPNVVMSTTLLVREAVMRGRARALPFLSKHPTDRTPPPPGAVIYPWWLRPSSFGPWAGRCLLVALRDRYLTKIARGDHAHGEHMRCGLASVQERILVGTEVVESRVEGQDVARKSHGCDIRRVGRRARGRPGMHVHRVEATKNSESREESGLACGGGRFTGGVSQSRGTFLRRDCRCYSGRCTTVAPGHAWRPAVPQSHSPGTVLRNLSVSRHLAPPLRAAAGGRQKPL